MKRTIQICRRASVAADSNHKRCNNAHHDENQGSHKKPHEVPQSNRIKNQQLSDLQIKNFNQIKPYLRQIAAWKLKTLMGLGRRSEKREIKRLLEDSMIRSRSFVLSFFVVLLRYNAACTDLEGGAMSHYDLDTSAIQKNQASQWALVRLCLPKYFVFFFAFSVFFFGFNKVQQKLNL